MPAHPPRACRWPSLPRLRSRSSAPPTAVGGKHAVMAEPSSAERTTGYVRGGISPLGQRKRLPTVVDASAVALATVYVSAGRRGLEVELAPADLVRLTDATVAPIAG